MTNENNPINNQIEEIKELIKEKNNSPDYCLKKINRLYKDVREFAAIEDFIKRLEFLSESWAKTLLINDNIFMGASKKMNEITNIVLDDLENLTKTGKLPMMDEDKIKEINSLSSESTNAHINLMNLYEIGPTIAVFHELKTFLEQINTLLKKYGNRKILVSILKFILFFLGIYLSWLLGEFLNEYLKIHPLIVTAIGSIITYFSVEKLISWFKEKIIWSWNDELLKNIEDFLLRYGVTMITASNLINPAPGEKK